MDRRAANKKSCEQAKQTLFHKNTNISEEEGFEPSVRLTRTHAFQACSFGRSDTPPKDEAKMLRDPPLCFNAISIAKIAYVAHDI